MTYYYLLVTYLLRVACSESLEIIYITYLCVGLLLMNDGIDHSINVVSLPYSDVVRLTAHHDDSNENMLRNTDHPDSRI